MVQLKKDIKSEKCETFIEDGRCECSPAGKPLVDFGGPLFEPAALPPDSAGGKTHPDSAGEKMPEFGIFDSAQS